MRGLVAQKKSGHFGRTWWGKQVEEALEAPYREGSGVIRHPAVVRAKALARNGAVIAMERSGTTVAGEVQGSQLDPFSPAITGTPVSADTLATLRDAIASQPGAAEEIIAGSLPAFLAELLPLSAQELRCSCTCPTAEERCAHTLALGYVLVERMDPDSSWYLQLRGIDLADILVSKDRLPGASRVQRSTRSIPIPAGTPVAREPRAGEPMGRASVAGVSGVGETPPDSQVVLDSQRYWVLSGELPELPHPLPAPAYRDLDPVQWMATASAYTSDPREKLTLESDLHDLWDYFADSCTASTDDKEHTNG